MTHYATAEPEGFADRHRERAASREPPVEDSEDDLEDDAEEDPESRQVCPHWEQGQALLHVPIRDNPTKIALFPTLSSIKAQSRPFRMSHGEGSGPGHGKRCPSRQPGGDHACRPGLKDGNRAARHLVGINLVGIKAPSSDVGVDMSRGQRRCRRGSARSETQLVTSGSVLRARAPKPARCPPSLVPPGGRAERPIGGAPQRGASSARATSGLACTSSACRSGSW